MALQDDGGDDCGGRGGVVDDDDSRAFLVFEELGFFEPSTAYYFLAAAAVAGKSVTDFLREQERRHTRGERKEGRKMEGGRIDRDLSAVLRDSDL